MKSAIDAKVKMLLLIILAHSSIPLMLIYSDFNDVVISSLVAFLTVVIGFSVTAHRLLAHRLFIAPRWFEIAGSIICSLGIYGPPLAIVAMHRQHHKFADTPNDVHKTTGSGSSFLSRMYARMFYEHIQLYYANDLLKDKFQFWLFKNYFKLNIAYASVLLIIDPFLVVSAYLFPGAVAYTITSLLTVISHYGIGYRNHPTPDNSNNQLLLMLLAGGEGLHNNHHNNPSKANFSERWFEFDLGYLICKLIDKSAK